jgi:hypothetical protein
MPICPLCSTHASSLSSVAEGTDTNLSQELRAERTLIKYNLLCSKLNLTQSKNDDPHSVLYIIRAFPDDEHKTILYMRHCLDCKDLSNQVLNEINAGADLLMH